METIYLDANATTPVCDEAIEAAKEAMAEAWGNPSSSHPFGERAREVVAAARKRVARLIGASPDEIVFTSGGTESDHLAIRGVAEAGRGRHVVTTSIEHPAVEEACRGLERSGFEVTRVPPRPDGTVDPAAVEAAFRHDTVLVSVMHANNETGVIQPIAEIARAARRRGFVVHADAAQSVGKVEIDVGDLGVDLLTIAGHKLYAPKGIGALYVRKGTPLSPYLLGGGQERGLRGGTEPVPGIAALGAAAQLAREERTKREKRLRATRDRLESALLSRFPDAIVHGASAPRLPNTSSIAFPGRRAVAILDRLRGVACSAGAACHAGEDTPSAVLLAMGIAPEIAAATLRLSTGRKTTEEEIDLAVERIAKAVGRA